MGQTEAELEPEAPAGAAGPAHPHRRLHPVPAPALDLTAQRLEWFLREHGRFPTRDELLAIRPQTTVSPDA